MMVRCHFLKWVTVFLMIMHRILAFNSVFSACDFSFLNNDMLYNFELASPIPKFPHGVLSEDGFYRVAGNDTILWFQLCDGMIFNHDPPLCVDCLDCGGPLRCGMGCSALVANKIEGYDVCSAIGVASSTNISIFDVKNPHSGVIVKMSNMGTKVDCSLSVSVICKTDGIEGPQMLEKTGPCHYATALRHPSGCAKVVHVDRRGWGWFGTFITMLFPTWNSGLAYLIERRVCLRLWCGNLGDLLEVIEIPILLSTSDHIYIFSWMAATRSQLEWPLPPRNYCRTSFCTWKYKKSWKKQPPCNLTICSIISPLLQEK